MTKPNNPPAFPSHGSMGEIVQEGMYLRDYIAIKAMEGLLSGTMGESNLHDSAKDWVKDIVESSYEYADAMLLERSKNAQ